MNPPTVFSELEFAVCIGCLALAPLAIAGLALINTGLGRSRNAAHSMLSALCAIGVACCVYLAIGHAFQGAPGEPAKVMTIGGKPWDWLGGGAMFFGEMTGAGPLAFPAAWMGLLSVCVCSLIPLGSAMERWRLAAICASTAILAGIIFPLFAHWSWGGGWLAQLGVNYGLGAGYADPGGSGTIHVVGGLTALAMVWILGPRRGKYGHDGMPMAIPGHNVVLTMFGCVLMSAGWFGFNAGGAMLFSAAGLATLPLIAVNTMLGASSGALAAAAATRVRFGRPDASLSANGWVAGLVATASGCSWLPPAAALLVGLVAGVLIPFSVEILELRFEIDDPGGSVSVHALAGIWGLMATGLFGRFPGGGSGQILAQLTGVATLLGFILPLAWSLNLMLNRFLPQRVTREAERQGMDLHELGAGAYPDFITHNDEYTQR